MRLIRQLTFAKKIAQIALSKKAKDVVLINVRRFTIVAEYFAIMTANSEAHRQTLAEEIRKKMNQNYGVTAIRIDGKIASDWTVIDYGGVLVHIFSKEAREIYDLEKLYYGARKIKYRE